MLGAILGDIIGSSYEWKPLKDKSKIVLKEDATFTDDTVLTIAVADAIMNYQDPVFALKNWGKKYGNRGYGPFFKNWLHSDNYKPYYSYGNGSAMRTSSVGFVEWKSKSIEFLPSDMMEIVNQFYKRVKPNPLIRNLNDPPGMKLDDEDDFIKKLFND